MAIKEYQNTLNYVDDGNLIAKSKIYYNIGNVFLEQKQYDKAIEQYIKALKLNPIDSDATVSYTHL